MNINGTMSQSLWDHHSSLIYASHNSYLKSVFLFSAVSFHVYYEYFYVVGCALGMNLAISDVVLTCMPDVVLTYGHC
jgi:hypothetical protein